MKEIKLDYQHGRLVFAVGNEEYFIAAEAVLSLLDLQAVSGIFHELKPSVIFRDFETFDFVVNLEILKEKGYSMDEIAEYLQVPKVKLETWLETRGDVIEHIKANGPSNFQSVVDGRKDRVPNKKA